MKTLSLQVGDIHLDVSGNLAIATEAEGLRQKLETRLQLYRGEWFLDVRAGIPYVQRILGRKAGAAPIEISISQIFDAEILKEDEVRSILRSDATYTREDRAFTYSADLETIYGPIELEVSING